MRYRVERQKGMVFLMDKEAKRTTPAAIQFPGRRYNAILDKERNIVGRRLNQIRLEKGYTLESFSELLAQYGVEVKRGGISKWEVGKALPSVYNLAAICHALDIPEGISYFFSDGDKSSLLNKEGLRKLEEYRKDLIASGRYKPIMDIRENQIRYITKRVSWIPASAGTGAFLDEENFEDMDFPEDAVPQDADFGIRVSGDSMEPVYHDRQIVWVERCDSLKVGEVGIFMYDGNGYIKVYGEQEPEKALEEDFTDSYGQIHSQPVLISYNRAYLPIPVSPNAEFSIVGRVLR